MPLIGDDERRRLVTASHQPAPLFGLNIDPADRNLPLAYRLADLADASGYDWVGIQDHPYIPQHLDTWTLMSVLAARTTRVRFIPNVLNLPLRQPAVLAKSAATLDVITAGRIEIGLGAGGYWDGIYSYGGPRRSPREAVDALDEAMHVMRLLWDSSAPATFNGVYYRLSAAKPGPPPAHRIGIWLGALGPRMLRLTGRAADGWLISAPYVPPEQVLPLQERIDDGARRAGRDPAAIRRGYNLMGVIELPGRPAVRPKRAGTTFGPVDHWVEQIVGYYRVQRMDTFAFWPLADEETQARAFIEQVVPEVKRSLRVDS
jgi:alkanesulfonate monooxygenase SsuD/methylene tetrahydromethanopterin reductase-like flavin-dependent oxidoreductase (luciferase family)